MKDEEYFNLVAVTMIIAVLTGGFAVLAADSLTPDRSPNPPATTRYLNLTIELNRSTGWPEYSPANFSVPLGRLVVTIVDQDAPAAWLACTCRVTGTVGGSEVVNGTSVASVSPANVAHTFTVGALGINVLSPGESTVSFTLALARAGVFTWNCVTPCGQGTNGYTSPPMGVPGYMTGTMTVF